MRNVTWRVKNVEDEMESVDIKIYNLEDVLEVRIIDKKENVNAENNEEELDSEYLENMLCEDYFDKSKFQNLTQEKKLEMIKRYRQIVNKLKKICGSKCQICGKTFLMDNGKYYSEAHHIEPLSENGGQTPENVIILCANHHRMFHYSKKRIEVGDLIDGQRKILIDDMQYVVNFEWLKEEFR